MSAARKPIAPRRRIASMTHDDFNDMIRRLVDEAMGTCEPENVGDRATAHTRKVLTRKFTACLKECLPALRGMFEKPVVDSEGDNHGS